MSSRSDSPRSARPQAHQDGVAISYIDTRNAMWPFSGQLAGPQTSPVSWWNLGDVSTIGCAAETLCLHMRWRDCWRRGRGPAAVSSQCLLSEQGSPTRHMKELQHWGNGGIDAVPWETFEQITPLSP